MYYPPTVIEQISIGENFNNIWSILLKVEQASSSVAILLVSENKKKRYILPNNKAMIHQPIGEGQGQTLDIETEAKEILKMKKILYNIFAKHSNQPIDKIKKYSNRNFYMNSKQSISYNIVDLEIKKKYE